ncbi:Uncharacterized protein OS=Singulisphaera acidiphila (strain ATCC BAA-1392 / DSM 18658 / VKM B-2454 / MOB10) GN=Sinac_1997 PE=4 SV=1 [Gemmataceae bacterium]|jgi:uncharacterized membrane protein|nr:Uncharacterized protein OS=Singulisphaera acidiphila (strain ATCC BAA-1392 / DSM 18658 / VKM B-2454 / MOB10) GN=Sinac_1997 PE=4 SV=1 [Gemmataceae bacterium]VTT97812.1 Uncharacterized protein OS=Singulisphaera acidiphila (strain ATCC BAA-1392 / DSM 18658 / VKM B-2454 / MOB10) GN=Sinac_1997 PE=4 SV=1 [Gemmataceae bacterium]
MRFALSTAALAAVLVVGCNKSPEGGTPGTSSSFKISAPTTSTTIKQDNAESVKVSLDRGKDFKQNVKLAVASPSDKVKAELNKADFKPGDPADAVLKVSVAKDAPLGEHVLKVTGTPEGGTATSVDVKIKVEAP